MTMLEEADDDLLVERMVDLPAELRVRICELHLAGLSNGHAEVSLRHKQPPVTMVSRLLRQEALHLFYSIFTLVTNFQDFAYGGVRGPAFAGPHQTCRDSLTVKMECARPRTWIP